MMHHSPVTRWVTMFSATMAPLGASATSWTGYNRLRSLVLAIVTMVGLSLALALTFSSLFTTPQPAVEPSSTVNPVLAYALTWRGPRLDPLLTVRPGLEVKSSNYDGIKIGNTRYYYDLAPQPSFDPLSRGALSEHQIRVIAIVGNFPHRVLIYIRLISPPSPLEK
ncbi:MAG: hypothetical protein M1335_02890 [Chloroflexi bacterium]|nr:hypothetical protein [Chloroflexota bacterium]